MLALDVDDRQRCLDLAQRVHADVAAFKLGPRLLMRFGPDLVREISALAPVFVDNKYLDIPSTMEAAVQATFDVGASYATVHAWAGPAALERLAKLEQELNKKRPFRVLAVTVLTSFSQASLPPFLRDIRIEEQVSALADLVIKSGLSGMVCSPEEVQKLRERHPHAFLVVPGIRSSSDQASDQARTCSAEEAMQRGASALVVGRPVLQASDPLEALRQMLLQIQGSRRSEV